MSGVARKVVFAPNLIGGALIDSDCAGVLEMWRDGFLLPVVSRELLRCYLRLLDTLGVPPRLLTQWTLWFTSPSNSLFVEAPSPGPPEGDLLSRAAAGHAEFIIQHTNFSLKAVHVPLISAKDFLSRFRRQGT